MGENICCVFLDVAYLFGEFAKALSNFWSFGLKKGTAYRRLRAASAKNNYKKESRFFLEIHGKAC